MYVAYDWKSLPPASVVVDVGGGVGTSVFPIAANYPKIQLIVRDLPGVVEDAKKVRLLTIQLSEISDHCVP